MVARITMPITINRALNYNEQKVQQGKAVCIGEGNMILPANCMNFYQKLDVFESRNKLNERADTKTIHISLNFDPSENHSTEKLNHIANDYMNRIGFGDQPYLIYQHNDAAHPHIHIVSTTIRGNGSRIPTHNIGRNQSETARKAIEDLYTLIPAQKQEKIKEYSLQPIEIEKAQYGYSETRRSIANIVSHVVNQYNFVSIPGYNAILKQYNIIADEGKEDGIIRRNRGLQYRIIDASGNKIGVPIKASALPASPTIANLEKKYISNRTKREIPKLALKNTIDSLLEKKPTSLDHLIDKLLTEKVQTILRKNEDNRIYGITFVDIKNKSVFNGSELGKQYSIAGLQKQFKKSPLNFQHQFNMGQPLNTDVLDALLKPEDELEQTPFELRKKRKKD
jgi:hypothetical protein